MMCTTFNKNIRSEPACELFYTTLTVGVHTRSLVASLMASGKSWSDIADILVPLRAHLVSGFSPFHISVSSYRWVIASRLARRGNPNKYDIHCQTCIVIAFLR